MAENYDSALTYFDEALLLSQEDGHQYNIAMISINKAAVFQELNRHEESNTLVKKGLELALRIKAKNLVRDAYKVLFELNQKQEMYDEAFKYHLLFSQTNDSIYSEESNRKINEMQIVYETEKKERQIAQLNIERRLKEAELRVQKRLLLGLTGGFILVLGFVIVLFLQKRALQISNAALVKVNLVIVASENRLKASQINKKVVRPSTIKYTGSALDDAQRMNILDNIFYAMDGEKLYLKDDLSILKLAEHIGTNKTYISQIINARYKMNFSNFINLYRIKEARRLLSDEVNKNLTIEAMASMVGFNSKSSFNNAFKKFTGLTPSYFMRSAMKSKDDEFI
ncbi:MAG: AraC family transcriptional regulator [Flavobacteriales bacterium]|nr:AraC family transcriptional regulator [Flavobacteriales bacterium]